MLLSSLLLAFIDKRAKLNHTLAVFWDYMLLLLDLHRRDDSSEPGFFWVFFLAFFGYVFGFRVCFWV